MLSSVVNFITGTVIDSWRSASKLAHMGMMGGLAFGAYWLLAGQGAGMLLAGPVVGAVGGLALGFTWGAVTGGIKSVREGNAQHRRAAHYEEKRAHIQTPDQPAMDTAARSEEQSQDAYYDERSEGSWRDKVQTSRRGTSQSIGV